MSLPGVLTRMSDGQKAMLIEDVEAWGTKIEGLTRFQVAEMTGFGISRAHRLHAYRLHMLEALPTDAARDNAVLFEDEHTPLPEGGGVLREEHPDGTVTVTMQVEQHPSSPLGQGVVRNLEELYEQGDIDPLKWTTDNFKVSSWPTTMKVALPGPNGTRGPDEVKVLRNWYVSATFRPRIDQPLGPQFWGPPLKRIEMTPVGGFSTTICIPDMHIGYAWSDHHRALVPLHDWDAIDAVLQLLKFLGPEGVQILGDVLDMAAFSLKFQVPIALRDTIAPSLATAYALLRRIREILPGAAIDFQGGNHDNRAERAQIGTEWEGLAAVGEHVPAHSFASLLKLNTLDITWRNYGEHRWLYGAVLIHHGEKVKPKGGATVTAVVATAECSEMFGHIHRVESASRTVHTPRGIRTRTVASPGTLARIDGSVPGVSKRPDWQQGVGEIVWDEGRHQEHVNVYHIHAGVLMYQGRRFVGNGAALAAEVAKATGYPQIAEGWKAAA